MDTGTPGHVEWEPLDLDEARAHAEEECPIWACPDCEDGVYVSQHDPENDGPVAECVTCGREKILRAHGPAPPFRRAD